MVDGATAVQRQLSAGERLTLEVRRELVLTAADAGALTLTLNGQNARIARQGRRERHHARHPREFQRAPGRPVMESTPLFDFFKRGEAARDVKLLAAQGTLAPRAHEQLAILILLLDDPDPEIRSTADQTLNKIPVDALDGVSRQIRRIRGYP